MAQKGHEVSEDVLRLIRTNLESLEFGQILITVHGSKVVQIERVERTRLDIKGLHDQGSGI